MLAEQVAQKLRADIACLSKKTAYSEGSIYQSTFERYFFKILLKGVPHLSGCLPQDLDSSSLLVLLRVVFPTAHIRDLAYSVPQTVPALAARFFAGLKKFIFGRLFFFRSLFFNRLTHKIPQYF